MRRTVLASMGVVLLAGAQVAVSQRDFSNVEFETTRVAGGVYLLESGAGGNIAVSAGEDGVLMIDDQFAPLAEKIRAGIRKAGGSGVRFLINTHYHGDHTGGNAEFGEEATIVGHTNVRKRLAEQGQPAAALPVVTFEESITIHFNGESVEIRHLPRGHTDSDSVVYFGGSNVVHMGDLFFAGRFPYIDLKAGGDVEGYMNNVQTVMDGLPAGVKIIPGHGKLATLEDLKTFHAALEETAAHIRGQMESGKSLEEIQAAGLPAKWNGWGEGFISTERWIEIVYSSYKG